VSLTAMQGASAPIALATLTMRDVGREGEAMRLGTGQMTQWVLGTIFKSVLAAVGGIGGSAVEGVKGAEKATVETVRKLGGKLGIGGSPQEPEKR
jgi:hypothetical protein